MMFLSIYEKLKYKYINEEFKGEDAVLFPSNNMSGLLSQKIGFKIYVGH